VDALVAIQDRGVDVRVLVDQQRTVAAILRGDQAQLAALGFRGEMGLLVARGDVLGVREQPDLQEVHGFVGRVVELAVADPAACAHALHVTVAQHRAGAHRVLVFQRAAQHVGDDLHVAVAVGAETLAADHLVFVDHPQRAEAGVALVVVAGEGEGVLGVQPAMVGLATGGALADLQHGDSPWCSMVSMAVWVGVCRPFPVGGQYPLASVV